MTAKAAPAKEDIDFSKLALSLFWALVEQLNEGAMNRQNNLSLYEINAINNRAVDAWCDRDMPRFKAALDEILELEKKANA
jgi:hypothetical protein